MSNCVVNCVDNILIGSFSPTYLQANSIVLPFRQNRSHFRTPKPRKYQCTRRYRGTDSAWGQRKIFQYICGAVLAKGEEKLYRDTMPHFEGVSGTTISNAWNSMFGSGMLDRERRNEPTSFSYDFARILMRLAMSWYRFLYVKGYIDEKEFDRVVKKEFK